MRDTDTDSTQEIEQQDLKRIVAAHEPNITVVHSGESLTIKWNPVTHKEVRNETADGGIILTVQPQDR